MAPPPPKKPAAGAGNGKHRPPPRPLKQPTIPIPAGMRLADSRSRGMALLFDFAVVLVIYWVVLLVVPGIINSDYQTKVDQIDHLNSLHDAQNDIDDAQKSVNDADKAITQAQNSGNRDRRLLQRPRRRPVLAVARPGGRLLRRRRRHELAPPGELVAGSLACRRHSSTSTTSSSFGHVAVRGRGADAARRSGCVGTGRRARSTRRGTRAASSPVALKLRVG